MNSSEGGQRWSSIVAATKNLGLSFWIAGMACAGGYAGILPFTSVFVAVRPAELNQESASRLISVVFLVCAFISPIVGRLIDRFGKGELVLCASSILICCTHSMFMSFDHIYVVGTLGLGYATFVASVWPMVPVTVEKSHVGLGYGLFTSLQNAALVLVPLITASIKVGSGSYSGSRWVFLASGLISLLASVWLALGSAAKQDRNISKEEETVPLTTG